MVHMENIAPLVMFISKFNIILSFQNVKNVDIVYIFLILSMIFFEQFFPFQTFPIPPFFVMAPHFLAFLPILKNILQPSPYAHFGEVLSSLTKK